MVPIFVAMVFSFPHVYVTTLPGQFPDWVSCEVYGYSTRVAPGEWVECHWRYVPPTHVRP
jgi:hypothetical protein